MRPGDDEIGRPADDYDEWLSGIARTCRSCPECSDVPCGACQAGGVCDRFCDCDAHDLCDDACPSCYPSEDEQ